MAKKIKTTVTTIQTRDELERVMGECARTAILRGQLELAMEEQINLVRKDYEARLADFDAEIETLAADLEAWAALNPDAFRERKSLDLTHGTIGFRTGQPTLGCIAGVKWEHVLDMLKCNRMAQYVRTIEEPNKEALLADREKIGADRLRALGMKVGQKERFFVEPKTEG